MSTLFIRLTSKFLLKGIYERRVADAYASGRRHFEAGEMEAALLEWEHARIIMPSLRAFSDIDYWRGRAFEAQGKLDEAMAAYETFLSYSERSTPDYFKDTYPTDPSWSEKADDAEKRMAKLRGAPVPTGKKPEKKDIPVSPEISPPGTP